MGAGVFKGPLQGILRCRDLVTLYYGVPMVTIIQETEPAIDQNATGQMFSNNPRRIAWQAIFSNDDPTNVLYVNVATSLDAVASNGQSYVIAPNNNLILSANFLTELDAVTLPMFAAPSGTALFSLSVREILLSAPPLDELPQP